ncbi:MAG: EAL domain-containing protein [Leptospiraceae bacterium]|nr:EAL domain-containing protein [Leptospiraceae bacterium]
MAFQPIIDAHEKKIYSHEALVRGVNNESAWSIISQVKEDNLYQFDQACRVKAIELASRLNMDSYLNINFLPNAVYKPEACIRTTMEACKEYNFPNSKVILEVTEGEKVKDPVHMLNIFKKYRDIGLLTAIDDFGEGYSSLNLLAEFQPDFVKLDRKLISGIDSDEVKQKIVKAINQLSSDLGIKLEAEGVETKGEFSCLLSIGVRYYQGYYFCKPVFEGLGEVDFSLW